VTEKAAVVNPVWVFDAMGLSHFARAERLDVLRDLLIDKECWTTQVVLEEVKKGVATYPALRAVLAADWIKIARLDTLDEIRLFALWARRLGSGERDLGKPVCSQQPSFVRRQPSLTIQGLCVSPGRMAWMCMAPYGYSRASAETASSRKPPVGI
jgi:hypothetical protein